MTENEQLDRMIDCLALAAAEWEAMHAPRGAETGVTPDADRLLRRAAQLAELAVRGDEGDE